MSQSWVFLPTRLHKNASATEAIIIKQVIDNLERHYEQSHSIKVSKPKAFNNTQSANKLENFLWDIEQYFIAAHIHNGKKVVVTILYMIEDDKL